VKKFFLFILTLFTTLALAPSAFATDVTIDMCAQGSSNEIAKILCTFGGTTGANVGITIRNVVVFFIVIAIVVALIYLLYGGIKWITSKGDKTEVEAARNHIMAAIIGLIVVILAVFIMTIILTVFGINWRTMTIPTLSAP
jgi:hypothetical protein